MAIFIRFLLLTLPLVADVYANEESTSEAVKWLEAERSVLVHLATPDLYFLMLIRNVGEGNERDQIATQYPGAFIFNFTLTPDNRTLLLNDEPILPRAHPHIPAPLRAHQTGESATEFAHRIRTNFSGFPVMDLDYYIETPDTTTGTSIYNMKYNPRIRLDILRASIPSLPGYSTPLSSNTQNQIWVWLEDLSAHLPNTLYSSIPLRIGRVKVSRRWLDADSQGTTTYKTLKSLKTCYIWSWLCADIDNYPYYEYIYRQNFDQYGKKGSMRHFLTTRWGNLVGLMGFGQAIAWLVVCGSMVLSPVAYAMFRGVKNVVEVYRKRAQEVDEWLEEEEVEGLLNDDRYIEDFEELEKEEVAEGKGGEKTSVEESLPPPPPYIPMKTEKSSTS
ncbi:hypothetical protein BP6252_12643 [Coleophoma cylindrospora]|uniref:Uncharacterized protein n=1 Tax=Coleophoma cylindrospora TaxID=1849047 RepID=A0A3D8QCH6_9HELO|nr:hypothetical protein BP6252_12643 [Coleophoma cylindrospora]